MSPLADFATREGMKLLAIDTAANLCAACVLDAGADAVMASRVLELDRGHAERLMDMVAEVLREAGLDYRDLDRLAVAVGPGSFMGIRTGVAAARGLSLALGIPAIGVTTLEAIAFDARAAFPGRPVLAAIDARRDEIYAAAFDAAGRETLAPVACRPAELASLVAGDVVLAGTGAPLLAALRPAKAFDIAAGAATGSIAAYARIAALRTPGDRPKPVYLRAPDARQQAGFALPRRSA